METQAAQRRINLIASHFASTGADDGSSPSHILPMNCSSLNPALQRYDNRVHFARQGSDSQAYFMKQLSIEQGTTAQPDLPLKVPTSQYGSSTVSEAPVFSRPARSASSLSYFSYKHGVGDDCKLTAPDPPLFARPNITMQTEQIYPKENVPASESNGLESLPKMDVAESARNYIVTVQLPGVAINDINVEVNDDSLTVVAKRSTLWWKVTNFADNAISLFHKREISKGPYHVMWPLPINANKDSVSAEYKDGILQIHIPKV